MKKTPILIIVLLFVLVGLVACKENSSSQRFLIKDAYITIDINPSIEIITGEDGYIVQVNPLNQEAEVLLSGSNFVSKTINEAIDEIIKLAADLGYLDFTVENAILVTTLVDNPDEEDSLQAIIKKRIEAYIKDSKMRINIYRTKLENEEGLNEISEQYNISLGKAKLITYAMTFDNTLSYEVAALMNMRELNQIIMAERHELKEFLGSELKGMYNDLRIDQQVQFIKNRAKLLNDALQISSDELFSELIGELSISVTDIKNLYSEYTEAVLKIEVDKLLVDESNFEEEIEILKQNRRRIFDEMSSCLRRLTPPLSSQDQTALRARMHTLRTQYQDIERSINKLFKEHQNNGNHFGSLKQSNLLEEFKTIRHQYQGLFDDLGVKLADVEKLVIDAISDDLNNLINTHKDQIQALKEEVQDQIEALRKQIQEEHDLLREVGPKGAGQGKGKKG